MDTGKILILGKFFLIFSVHATELTTEKKVLTNAIYNKKSENIEVTDNLPIFKLK